MSEYVANNIRCECRNLINKIIRLQRFIMHHPTDDLDEPNLLWLEKEREYMLNYLGVLIIRLQINGYDLEV